MQFHLNFPIQPLNPPAKYDQKYLLMGSCFAEEMGKRLRRFKFDVLVNPHGTQFNPISITHAIETYLNQKKYEKNDLFCRDSLWHSWDHHGGFSHPDAEICLARINESQKHAFARLSEANWLILTLGSAWAYELSEGNRVVANCHKMPTDLFSKVLLKPQQVIASLDNVLHRLFLVNKSVRVIFTVSPVRYIRDGMVENNLSKSILLYCIHRLVGKFDRLHYFPAYELVMDDLRDYRFYKDDLVHPNDLAVDYVWDQFTAYSLDADSAALFQEVKEIVRAAMHRPLHPMTGAYRQLQVSQLKKIRDLEERYPFLDFSTEKVHFQT